MEPPCSKLRKLADALLDHRYIYTGGSESYIRVFESDPESTKEARLIEYCDEGITSLSCSVSHSVLHLPDKSRLLQSLRR